MRGRLAAWGMYAALILACVVAAGDRATSAATPSDPALIPPSTDKPSPPLPVQTRSGIGTAAVLTLYANKTADDTGAAPGDCTAPANTDCSLRAALGLANANAGSTINVAAGTFTLAHADTADATSGLVVSASVTIAGAGAGSTFIEANAAPNTATYRVLRITGANVTVQGVTIRNGVIAVPGGATNGGGGVRIDTAGAAIQDSTISGNTASGTDATPVGGGIVVLGGDATLLRTTVSGNVASVTVTSGTHAPRGGGAAAISGPLTVRDSLIVGNTAQGTASSGTLQTIGGGIVNQNTTTISNSTITSNNASGGTPFGGGLANLATMTITSSTLSGNTATATSPAIPQGGGIHNQATVTFTNTIIANSTGGDFHTFGGTFTGDNNLFDDNSVLPTGTGNVNNTPALLSTLGDYGGPTQTIPLLPGSPAINAGAAVGHGPTGPPANTVPAADQRGKPRVGVPDIGAFESQGFTMTKQGDNQTAPTTGIYANALAVTLTPANPGEPVNGGQVTFTVVPNAGASATFGTLAGCTVSGDGLTTICTISSSKATSPPLTANDTVGTFTVTATTLGVTTPQTFTLHSIAITLVVNTATDGVGDFTRCATNNPNTCRLRDAIAGATPSKHTITFADAAFPPSTPTTILLTANTFSLSTTVTVDGTGHKIVLNGGCTSCGIGGNPTNGVRVLVVQRTGVVTFIGLTITGGNNGAGPSAGILNAGTLTLTNSTVSGNYAPNGDGGGIGNDGGTLILMNSTVTGNTSTRGGGGIYNYDNSQVGSKVTLINSTVSGNAAVGGGGIFNYNGKLMIVGSTVSGNTVSSQGGGIFNEPGGTLALVNSTVSGNTASAEGGGIYFQGGTGALTNVTVSGNTGTQGGGVYSSGASVTRTNSIVAGNTNPSGSDEDHGPDESFTGSNNVIGGNPMLGPLLNNGGPTQTMLPNPGSPALDGYAPTGGSCGSFADPVTGATTNFTTDQRGVLRPQGAACDIGAVEVSLPLTIIGVSPASGGIAGGNKVAITGAGFGTTAANVQVRVDGTAIPAASIVSVTDTQIVYIAPAHAAGNATVTVVAGGTTAPGSATYTYDTVNSVPSVPSGGSTGNSSPNPVPGGRPSGAPSGNPNPIPGSRP